MALRRAGWVAALVTAGLLSGAVYAAERSYWRPVMPEFVIDVRTADKADKSPSLMFFYWEQGADPLRAGRLAPGWRTSMCEAVGPLCVSEPARHEFHVGGDRRQSLQVRLFNGNGNPIVGGVSWTGPAYPKQVKIICDLRISDPQRTCAIADRPV